MTVTVINGEAGVGDRVAYAVREGNRAGIRLGTIVDITAGGALKVKVEYETPYYWERSQAVRTVRNLNRVVLV